MKIVSLVGARPQFIKEAVLNAAVRKHNAWTHLLVHSGQHYDRTMSDIFFKELGIPAPDYNLQVGSGSHAETTSAVLLGMEKILLKEKPDALIVYGDTNTTLGGALAAAKIHIPVIHVEAGIRMLPRDMPEEINRVMTDHLSTVMCCCSELAAANLRKEGISSGVYVCGDIMYDVFLRSKHLLNAQDVCSRFDLEHNQYVVATVHRDYNTDHPGNLKEIITALSLLRKRTGLRVILPLHPRTHARLNQMGLMQLSAGLDITEPLGYRDLMSLVADARFVVTDSGGLQREAYYAGKRCVVIMPDTGWRELTITGWNLLATAEAQMILQLCEQIDTTCQIPEKCYGQGDTAEKIIQALHAELSHGPHTDV